MIQNPPKGMTRITPLIVYEDIPAALDWLGRVFGFTERMRLRGDGGRVIHGEMDYAEGVLMLGTPGEAPDSKAPNQLGGTSQTLYVYVDDVDKHHAHAESQGARIVTPPQTMFWGDRTYVARDPEGHRWLFAQRVKDVSLESMGA